jgi:hypothetical protein
VGENLAEKKLTRGNREIETTGEILCPEVRAQEFTDEDGMECLRSAAEEQLRLHGGEIAAAQGKKAVGGNLNSAKFLIAILKEKARPIRWRPRDGPTEAQRLAAEPPWEEPPAGTSSECADKASHQDALAPGE